MPNSKIISTETIVTSFSNALTILTFYDQSIVNCSGDDVITAFPNILQGLIADSDGVLNTVLFKQGDLLITGKNMPTDIDVFLDEFGKFNIIGIDADKYSINEQGHLIYLLCE